MHGEEVVIVVSRFSSGGQRQPGPRWVLGVLSPLVFQYLDRNCVTPNTCCMQDRPVGRNSQQAHSADAG